MRLNNRFKSVQKRIKHVQIVNKLANNQLNMRLNIQLKMNINAHKISLKVMKIEPNMQLKKSSIKCLKVQRIIPDEQPCFDLTQISTLI